MVLFPPTILILRTYRRLLELVFVFVGGPCTGAIALRASFKPFLTLCI